MLSVVASHNRLEHFLSETREDLVSVIVRQAEVIQDLGELFFFRSVEDSECKISCLEIGRDSLSRGEINLTSD